MASPAQDGGPLGLHAFWNCAACIDPRRLDAASEGEPSDRDALPGEDPEQAAVQEVLHSKNLREELQNLRLVMQSRTSSADVEELRECKSFEDRVNVGPDGPRTARVHSSAPSVPSSSASSRAFCPPSRPGSKPTCPPSRPTSKATCPPSPAGHPVPSVPGSPAGDPRAARRPSQNADAEAALNVPLESVASSMDRQTSPDESICKLASLESAVAIRRHVLNGFKSFKKSKTWKEAGTRLPLCVVAVLVALSVVLALARLGRILEARGRILPCGDHALDSPILQHIWITAPLATMLLSAGCCAMLVALAATSHLIHGLAWFATVNWAAHSSHWLTCLAECDPEASTSLPAHMSKIAWMALNVALPALAIKMVVHRLALLEDCVKKSFGTQGLRQLAVLLLPLFLVLVAASIVFTTKSVLFAMLLHVFLLWWCAGNALAVRGLVDAWRIAKRGSAQDKSRQAQKVEMELRLQLSSTILAFGTMGLHAFVSLFMMDWLWPFVPPDPGTSLWQVFVTIRNITELLDTAGNCYFALALGSMLSPSLTEGRRPSVSSADG